MVLLSDPDTVLAARRLDSATVSFRTGQSTKDGARELSSKRMTNDQVREHKALASTWTAKYGQHMTDHTLPKDIKGARPMPILYPCSL